MIASAITSRPLILATGPRELRFVSSIRLHHAPADFRATDIKDFARTYPFAYAPEDWPRLERFIQPLSPHPAIDRWSATFFHKDGTADTHALLGAMTRTIRRTFKHVSRHEKGIQAPVSTLKLGSGSCRDLAVLMIAALRARGIAARFVSGYLHLADDDEDDDDVLRAATPTPGFRSTFPVRAGSTSIRREAVWEMKTSSASRSHLTRARRFPLQGTWFGTAADHLAMKVAVKVTTAPATGA